MPINTSEIMEVVTTLTNERKIQVSVTESFKGGLIAGGTTILGGLILGPVGMALGGLLGGVTASKSCKQFQPLAQVLMELPDSKKRMLELRIQRILADLDVTDLKYLMILMSSQAGLTEMIVKEVINYAQNDLHLAVSS